MWTAAFWKAATERAAKSFAQGVIAAGVIGVVPVTNIPWWATLSAGASMALLSLATSVASSQVGSSGPSLTSAERLP